MVFTVWHHVYWIGVLVIAFVITQVRAYHVANHTAEHWATEEWCWAVAVCIVWPLMLIVGSIIGILWVLSWPGSWLGRRALKRRRAAK
jgi:hypothetical protein